MKLVPPSIHPDVISRYYMRDQTTGELLHDGALNALVSAARSSHEMCKRIEDVRHRILSNKMATELFNETRLRETISKMLEAETKKVDAAVAAAVTARDAEMAKFAHPPKAKNIDEATVMSDTRAALARMPTIERRKAVDAAINAGEDMVISAVLNAPSLTSGFSKVETDAIRANFQRTRFPQEVARAARLDRAADDLLRGAQSMIGYCNSFTNAERIHNALMTETAANTI